MKYFEDMVPGEHMTSPPVVIDGDEVYLRYEIVEARPSSSKPDRGVVTVRLSLINDADEVVMSHLDTVLVRRRPPHDS